jgi:hypothetical protein
VLPGDRYYIYITIYRDMWDDAEARDWAIHTACNKARLALVSDGLTPWGRPRLRWLPPQYEPFGYACFDPDSLRGVITWRGVPVVPVLPTEWDTCL